MSFPRGGGGPTDAEASPLYSDDRDCYIGCPETLAAREFEILVCGHIEGIKWECTVIQKEEVRDTTIKQVRIDSMNTAEPPL
jgi:hypothetical protein